MTLTPKQRAILMAEGGLSEGVIAGVLGIELADVQRLMVEATPDVHLPGGGIPSLRTIMVEGVDLNTAPDINVDVETWDDLLHLTAPTDAAAYWFQVLVNLSGRYSAGQTIPAAFIYATDAEGFATWWNVGNPPLPGIEASLRGDGEGVHYWNQRYTLRLPVGPGQVIGLAQAEQGSDSLVTWWDACWIPVT